MIRVKSSGSITNMTYRRLVARAKEARSVSLLTRCVEAAADADDQVHDADDDSQLSPLLA